MRKFFCVVLLVLLPINGFGQANYVFQLTDGYFQSGDAKQPVHLAHPAPYPPQWVDLGGSVHIWYMITLRPGEKSPCDRRSKTPCIGRISFVSLSDPKYSVLYEDDFRIDDELNISYGIPINREKTPLGDGKFVWTVEKDGKVLFLHEILVEVK